MHENSPARRASWRRGAAVLTALLLGLGTVAGPATAAVPDSLAQHRSGSQDGSGLRMWDDGWTTNRAHVTNSGTGKERTKVRSALVRTDDRRIFATNVARARASCRDCRTVAVAFEVVLASGRPRDVAFHNEAVAQNRRCTRCETVAMAYQIAVVAPGVELTDEGVAQLRAIDAQIRAVASDEDMAVDQVVYWVDALVGQAMAVLDEELYQQEPRRGPRPRRSDAPHGVQSSAPQGELALAPSATPSIVLRSDIDRP